VTMPRKSSRTKKLRLVPNVDTKRYRYHRLAGLFPLIKGEELKALAADITANGLRVPILLHNGTILDGRNRYRACKLAGVEPRFEEVRGTDAEALDLVLSLNLIRRHLTIPQRAAIAIKLLPVEKKLARERMLAGRAVEKGSPSAGEANQVAGTRMGISGETVRQAARISKDAPDVLKAMAKGTVRSMPEAIKLAEQPKKMRNTILTLLKKKEHLRVDEALKTLYEQERCQNISNDVNNRKKQSHKIDPKDVRKPNYRLLYGIHAIEAFQDLPDKSVHICCTSPPYYGGLREYSGAPVDWSDGWTGHLGDEPDPDQYIAHLVEVMEEVARVLRPDGTLWLNLADCHASSLQHGISRISGLKPKDLVGTPWRVALALREAGWHLRSDILWHKPSALPESVHNRVTQDHEYIFMLARSEQYFYDAYAVREPAASAARSKQGNDEDGSAWRNRRSIWTVPTLPYKGDHHSTWPPKLVELMVLAGTSEQGACSSCGAPWMRVVEKGKAVLPSGRDPHGRAYSDKMRMGRGARRKGVSSRGSAGAGFGRRKQRMVGWAPTCKCRMSHPVPCVVLDPFSGSAATGVAALGLGRDYLGIDLNIGYLKQAEERLRGIRRDE